MGNEQNTAWLLYLKQVFSKIAAGTAYFGTLKAILPTHCVLVLRTQAGCKEVL